jgi:hypothetical protein
LNFSDEGFCHPSTLTDILNPFSTMPTGATPLLAMAMGICRVFMPHYQHIFGNHFGHKKHKCQKGLTITSNLTLNKNLQIDKNKYQLKFTKYSKICMPHLCFP